jgi:type I restriction enzyme, S subunit
MAGNWEELTLADLGRIVTGKTPLTAVKGNFGGHIPFVTPSDMDGRRTIITTARYLTEAGAASVKGSRIPAGSVMVSCIGSDMGKAVIAGRDCVTNQQINSIIVDDRFSSEFVYYNLSTRKSELRHQAAGGSAQPILNKGDFARLEIMLPPPAEQRAIVAVLGALDDKIELNRRMNATLEAMARALFQSWFVDFDPVRAKRKGRQPAGLDAETAALFPAAFQGSDNGKLPLGWRHSDIAEVCAINAWTLGKNDVLSTLEYVEISEVSGGNITNIANYERGEEPSRARRRLKHGDTVVSTVRPDRGSYFLSLNPPKNRVASTGFAVLTPTKAPWSFVHAAMTQPEVFEHLGQMADGGAYPAVRPEAIGAWKVALPGERLILEAFHRSCAPLFERAEANRAQSRTLATLRDTLLPKLLSGELRVAAAAKRVEARA